MYLFSISDLKQELQVRERCPDNERNMNGYLDSNRLKVENETQTTPVKRKIHEAFRNFAALLEKPFIKATLETKL